MKNNSVDSVHDPRELQRGSGLRKTHTMLWKRNKQAWKGDIEMKTEVLTVSIRNNQHSHLFIPTYNINWGS